MTHPSGDAAPGTLSWAALGLALLVGAGVPLLWWWLAAPPAQPAAVVQPTVPVPMPIAGRALQSSSAAAPVVPVTPVVARPAVTAVATPARTIARVRDPDGDLSPDITDFINAGEVPTMSDVISRLHAAGVHGGLGAFSPPGTRPPLVGVAVGDDFELPPGYVRHHQATDDGQRIEPILMYAPDHPLVAALGPAARPQDRVVPVDRLPVGLPARLVVVPAPAGSGKSPP